MDGDIGFRTHVNTGTALTVQVIQTLETPLQM